MSEIASEITSLTIVYSFVYSEADERKHQSSASLAFVWGIHRGPVNSPHKWPVTRKMFPFDDVIMLLTVWQQAINGTNAGLLLISPFGTLLHEICSNVQHFLQGNWFANAISKMVGICYLPQCVNISLFLVICSTSWIFFSISVN